MSTGPDNESKKDKPKKKFIGFFGNCEIAQFQQLLFIPFLLFVAFGAYLLLLNPHSKTKSVIIYTSQDEEYADPIFHDFEKRTGI